MPPDTGKDTRTMIKRNQKEGYLFLLPLVILVGIFLLYPFLKGMVLSCFATKYGFGDMEFSGFKNFIAVMKREEFQIAIKNSLVWVFVSVALNTTIPALIAIALNRDFWGKTVVFGVMLLSWITPVVGYSMMWKWLLEPELGIVNRLLMSIGLVEQPINFLGTTQLALPTCIILNFLQFCPFGVLLVTSALTVIPKEEYEAMSIDGAGFIEKMRYLIMPAIGSMIGFLTFLGIVWTFSNYSLIYILTKGGPSYSTYTVPMMIYEKAFSEFQVGQSLALATIMSVVLIAVGIIFFRKNKKTEK